MRIDQKALYRCQALEVNTVIDEIWTHPETSYVDKEGFIQSSWGPDAIELLVAGDTWIVCDRPEPNAVIYCEDGVTQVASRKLFLVCAKFSPLERL